MSPFIVIAAGTIIAVGLVVLLVGVVQGQRHLRSVQIELDRAHDQIMQFKQANEKLATSVAKLETEVDEANKARTDIQGKLDEANSTIEQLRKDLATSQSQLKEKDADD